MYFNTLDLATKRQPELDLSHLIFRMNPKIVDKKKKDKICKPCPFFMIKSQGKLVLDEAL